MQEGDKIVAELRHERETKGTHLYVAVDEINSKVANIYIRKGVGGIDGAAPSRIRLTVEATRVLGDSEG
jgi:hypothetical protein